MYKNQKRNWVTAVEYIFLSLETSTSLKNTKTSLNICRRWLWETKFPILSTNVYSQILILTRH